MGVDNVDLQITAARFSSTGRFFLIRPVRVALPLRPSESNCGDRVSPGTAADRACAISTVRSTTLHTAPKLERSTHKAFLEFPTRVSLFVMSS